MKNKISFSQKKIEENFTQPISEGRKYTKFSPPGFPLGTIHHLHRTIGNQAVIRLIQTNQIQTKLTIGAPNDKFEKEADRIADLVMQKPVQASNYHKESQTLQISTCPGVRKQSTLPPLINVKLDQKNRVQFKAVSPTEAVLNLENKLASMQSFGQPMQPDIRKTMENQFGTNFSQIRIHTGNQAAQLSHSLNAEAFTYRNHIFFGANRFNSTTNSGKKLLAHELTHTLQQGGPGCRIIQRKGGTPVGVLGIHTNVVNAGLTAGHAWISYTPNGGSKTTYGTWGNRTPIGLHRDIELAYTPAATRTTAIDSADHSSLTSFATANNEWGYINNCTSFAARGWRAVTGERLSYTNFLGIPNPSSLGAGIIKANGGGTSGTLTTIPPGASSSYGSSGSSGGGSSTGSSGASSGSSL